jgi:hypothetical protein
MRKKCGRFAALATAVLLGVWLVTSLRVDDRDETQVVAAVEASPTSKSEIAPVSSSDASDRNPVQSSTASDLDSHEDQGTIVEKRELVVPDEQPSGQQQKTRSEIIRAASEKWQALLGRVDFSEEPLFNSMAYIHPQPMANIKPFEGVVLSEALKMQHSFWLNVFFKDAVLDKLQKLSPNGYYLNEGRLEPSFLLFETTYEQKKITLLENGDLVLLTVKSDGYDPGIGLTKDFLEAFLEDCLRLEEGKDREVLSDFSLQSRMAEGFTFASGNAGDFLNYRDWQDQIVGFVGSRGVSVILFKTDSKDKTRLGIQYDFNWLNQGLLKEGENTLIDQSVSPTSGARISTQRAEGADLDNRFH